MNTLLSRILESPEIQFTIDNVAVREFPAAYTFGPHAHRFVELDFIEAGNCGMLFGTELVRLGAGDCLLIYPDVPHYFFTRARTGCTIVQLEFAVENFPWPVLPQLGEEALVFLDEVRNHAQPFRKLLPQAVLSQCIRAIRQESTESRRGRDEMLRLLFAQLLILLSREVEGVYATTEPAFDSGRDLAHRLASRLANEYAENQGIEELSVDFGVSSRYLRRCFHDVFGMSIIDYLTGLRLRKASALLARPDLSILEIALQSGFGSSQYFARVFKREMGLSPGDFRKLLVGAGRDSLPGG